MDDVDHSKYFGVQHILIKYQFLLLELEIAIGHVPTILQFWPLNSRTDLLYTYNGQATNIPSFGQPIS